MATIRTLSVLFSVSTLLLISSGRALCAQVAAADAKVIGSVAHIDLLPQDLKKAADAFQAYLATAPKEKGAVEIRMIQQIGSPNHFTLLEFWASKKSYDDHLASANTREFRRAIAPYLGSPYDERLHTEKLNFVE